MKRVISLEERRRENGKIKKQKIIKTRIITAVIILVVVCLLFIFVIPVRGAPSESFKTYDEFTKKLNKSSNSDFIAPSGELLPNVPSRSEISYKGSGEPSGQISPIIFDARGLFPTTRLYLMYSNGNPATGYMIIGRRLEKQELEEEKAKFVPTETINGIAVNVDENGYRFFIDDIRYSISKGVDCEIISMEQMKKIAEDIISQSK